MKFRIGVGKPATQIELIGRRFRLLDAMILVAATAVGCVLTRCVTLRTDGMISWSSLGTSWESFRLIRANNPSSIAAGGYFLTEAGFNLIALLIPILATWTLAFVPMRLTGPRPRLRRLMSQPGMIVACSLVLAILFAGSQALVAVVARGRDDAFLISALWTRSFRDNDGEPCSSVVMDDARCWRALARSRAGSIGSAECWELCGSWRALCLSDYIYINSGTRRYLGGDEGR